MLIQIAINKEGNIEVINVRPIEELPLNFPYFVFGSEVTLSIRILDPDTRKLLDRIHPTDDNRNYTFWNSFKGNNFTYYDNQGERYYLTRQIRKDMQQHLSIKLDENLNFTSERRVIDLGLPTKLYDVLYGGILTTDRYWITFDAKILYDSNYKRVYSLRYWDKDRNLVYDMGDSLTQILANEEDVFDIKLLAASHDRAIVRVKQYPVYIIKTDGTLLKKINLKRFDKERGCSHRSRFNIYDGEVYQWRLKLCRVGHDTRFEILRCRDTAELLLSSAYIPYDELL